jgi:hypothetical protein
MESASLDIRKYIAERLGDLVQVPKSSATEPMLKGMK